MEKGDNVHNLYYDYSNLILHVVPKIENPLKNTFNRRWKFEVLDKIKNPEKTESLKTCKHFLFSRKEICNCENVRKEKREKRKETWWSELLTEFDSFAQTIWKLVKLPYDSVAEDDSGTSSCLSSQCVVLDSFVDFPDNIQQTTHQWRRNNAMPWRAQTAIRIFSFFRSSSPWRLSIFSNFALLFPISWPPLIDPLEPRLLEIFSSNLSRSGSPVPSRLTM